MIKNRQKGFNQDPLWYKDAVIYQVHVKSFFDANNDGIGDFAGLIDKLDYISDLGVNTIWLLPFFPSPRRDDGYDIADYRDVHPDYGRMADVRRFIVEAHKRGLRVIFELVINHTSDQHPWFERARRAPKGSSARNFYVWSDDDKRYAGTRIIFLDTEKSNWTWDPVAGQYYWHRFYSHQPDLNFDHPQVLREVLAVMRFWLNMGVDGLRLDAIPYLIERDGTNNENLPETHQILKKIRAELDQRYTDRMLLAEANQWPEDTQLYFGDHPEGDECHMAFHFPLMPRMYMALAQEDRFPITDILRQTPEIPANCQWAIFLRNHDELTLEMVTDKERDHLWNYYAADRRARINLGIRRRLAPLMERDRRRIELMHCLLLTMPGTPTLYYGDELGMGDNIYLGDRDGVRTPMQWSDDRNGGFSTADPARMVLPPIQDPLYGYQTINVEAQMADAHSLLNWTRRMLMVRKQQKAFGRGSLRMLTPSNRRILAYLREYTDDDGNQESILCVANVARAAQAVELDLAAFAGKVPVEMTGSSVFPPIAAGPYQLSLAPYGFYWFYLSDQTQMPSWHVEPPQPLPDLTTLVVKQQLAEVLQGGLRTRLETEILPLYLSQRRWFAGDQAPELTIAHVMPLTGPDGACFLLCQIAVSQDTSEPVLYQLPLGFASESTPTLLPQQLALARVRRGREVGLLTDAFSLTDFVLTVVAHMQQGETVTAGTLALEFQASQALDLYNIDVDSEIDWFAGEQSNSSVLIAGRMVLKVLRTLQSGIHPEVEMGEFLTRKGFTHCAPLLGTATVRNTAADNTAAGNPEDNSTVSMMLQGYLDNQGDAWEWTQAILQRAIRDALTGGLSTQSNQFTALAELEGFAQNLGRRLGAMHITLAGAEDEADFRPHVSTAADIENYTVQLLQQLSTVEQRLQEQRAALDAYSLELLEALQVRAESLRSTLRQLAGEIIGGLWIRVHGDLHLGQILVVQEDAYFIDFEGEPARTLAQRRARTSPYKDVAGVLRSFEYALASLQQNFSEADRSDELAPDRQFVMSSYREKSVEAFLEAYQLASLDIPHQWRSEHGPSAAVLLFSLEKACYEILYEAAHRPAWVSIPLQGLLSLADQAEEALLRFSMNR